MIWQPLVAAPGLIIWAVTLVSSLIALPFLPSYATVLAALAAGVLAGWYLHAPRVDMLQAALEESEYERGRVLQQNMQLVRGMAATAAMETTRLPRIGGDNS